MWEKAQLEKQLSAAYDQLYYKDLLASEPSHYLLIAVQNTHHAEYQTIFQELQIARDLLYEDNEGARILSCVRAYRGIEAYQTRLQSAIIEAFTDPFRLLFKKEIKPRSFFLREVLESLQSSVLEKVFGKDLMGAFFKRHASLRNFVVLGLMLTSEK
jgi:hypothetical protein